jgi:xanthine/CO dehydrogenase XdhC/CoxF family maturation factor
VNELRAVLDGIEEAGEGGEPAVLATVVRVRGSAYRGPGARRLLTAEGHAVGLVSGGCLEGDLARRAWGLTEDRPVALVRYDTSDPDAGIWEFGLGCRGVVDILLERLPRPAPAWAALLSCCLRFGAPCVLVRVLSAKPGAGARLGSFLAAGGGEVVHDIACPDLAAGLGRDAAEALAEGRSGHVAHDGGRCVAFVEFVPPAPTLLVCGSGPDAVPLTRLARELGWRFVVADPRNRPGLRGRFPDADEVAPACDAARLRDLAGRPRTAAVVMTHNVIDDERVLRVLLDCPVSYLGLLGPRHRTSALLRSLAADGVRLTGPAVANLHTPAGLDIGAESPAEIALAILAEAQAALAGRAGGRLRDRRGAIHDRPEAAPLPPLDAAAALPACAVGAGS